MAEKMTVNGNTRVKQLTRDTGKALAQVCRGLVDLTRHLLASGFEYVLLGWFTTDPLEKYFSKLRQGSGGAYFITVQGILEKTKILQTKLCLQLGIVIDGEDGHACSICSRPLDEMEAEIMDHLAELEDNIPTETMLSIVYIAGYVEKYGKTNEEADDTMFYYQKYSSYFDALDRGGLHKPSDSVVRWSIFCYIFFVQLMDRSIDVCGKFLIQQFSFIAKKFDFDINQRQCRALANMWLKNFSTLSTPRSAKESKLKEIKLD